LLADHFDEISEKLPIIHFLMVVAAIWFGCNNAARDIVGEWTIYKRERMVTLKLGPYVFSKLAVLLALCIFQCGSMLAIVYYVCGLHSNFGWDFLVLLLSSMIGAGLGLTISAMSKTNESAIALLPVVLLPIIALGGGMRPVYLMPEAGQVLSTVIPSRWSFEANMLHEAEAKEWGGKQPVPDLTCKIPLDHIPPGALPSGAQGLPPGVQMDAKNLNPSLNVLGDAAEGSIPAYLITFTDPAGAVHTCRASANQQYPPTNPTDHAIPYRHSFRDSMAVLGAMLLVLIAGVIAILRMRDSDPQ
jgi:hypothetical protein